MPGSGVWAQACPTAQPRPLLLGQGRPVALGRGLVPSSEDRWAPGQGIGGTPPACCLLPLLPPLSPTPREDAARGTQECL